MNPVFLTYEEVLEINSAQVRLYGGSAGVRDEGLLLSALAMPQAGFGDAYAHADIYEMAAAYLYHIVKNHPFIDGNKRCGAFAARLFLILNGFDVQLSNERIYDLVIRTAEGCVSKGEIAAVFRENAVPARHW